MEVVAHQAVGADVDGEDVDELRHALGDPEFAVIEVMAAGRIVAAQEGAPHHPADAMIEGGGCDIDELMTRLWHGGPGKRAAMTSFARSLVSYGAIRMPSQRSG